MYKAALGILAVLTASAAAHAGPTISLGGPSSPGVNWGYTHPFTTPFGNIIASGFTAANKPQDLYGKNGGGDGSETGLGIANPQYLNHDNEIYYGYGYVQLDVFALFNKVSSISFLTNSTTGGEQWSVYGSNSPNSYNPLTDFLLAGTDNNGGTLPGIATNSYRYYDFVSTSTSGGKDFLIASLTLTAVPEPATWAMMLLGFGAIGFAMRRRNAAKLQLA